MNPKVPKDKGFSRGYNISIHWYVRIPTDPPPLDPKVEMQPELYVEESATLE